MWKWTDNTVHIGTNNADKEGTTAIVKKYRDLPKETKEARVEQIILSGILPVFGTRSQKDTEIQERWQSTGWYSSCVGKRK